MAENDKKNPYAKKAKLYSNNEDGISVELIVKEGRSTKPDGSQGNHYAVVEITTPEGEKIKYDDASTQISLYEYGGKQRFSVARPTGRKTTNEAGAEVNEYGRFVDGVVLNREDNDERGPAIPVTVYSIEESIAIIDRQKDLAEGADPASVYEGLGTNVFMNTDRQSRDATNEFFGIKPSSAFLAKVAKRQEEAKAEAEAAKSAEAPAPEAPAADAETDSKPAPRRAF